MIRKVLRKRTLPTTEMSIGFNEELFALRNFKKNFAWKFNKIKMKIADATSSLSKATQFLKNNNYYNNIKSNQKRNYKVKK